MKNYSKQREAILEVLRSTKTHPTASWVYERVKEKIPNISLGTVYRNLDALSKDGVILNISVDDGFEHFDGDILPHIHFYCKECGKIIDFALKNDNAITQSAEKIKFSVSKTVYVAYGICSDCKND